MVVDLFLGEFFEDFSHVFLVDEMFIDLLLKKSSQIYRITGHIYPVGHIQEP